MNNAAGSIWPRPGGFLSRSRLLVSYREGTLHRETLPRYGVQRHPDEATEANAEFTMLQHNAVTSAFGKRSVNESAFLEHCD